VVEEVELYKSNMFNLDNLKEIKYTSDVIEGGGDGSDQKPRINTDEQDIQTMNQDDLYFYIHNYANNVFEKDLLGRNAQPFYSNGVNRIDEFMGILAVESLSNRNSTGEYTEYKPKPYNVNASLQNDFNDSYGVFQIDTGPALPYIFMTMEGANADDVRSLAETEDMNIVMTYAKKLFENDDVKNEVYSFLKDPNNIDKHIKIAATIWNDHQLSKLKKDGAKGWNAYNNYNNKTKGKEYLKRINKLDTAQKKVSEGKKMMKEGQKERKRMVDTGTAFQFRDKKTWHPLKPGEKKTYKIKKGIARGD